MTLKLDLGCGPNPKEGFVGLDQYTFDKENVFEADLGSGIFQIYVEKLGDVKLEVDVSTGAYILPDSSVDEVHCSHFLEHLDMNQHHPQRVAFCNELYRVLKPDAGAMMVTPHWCSSRAMGDWTHADKPVTEFFYYYLSSAWRAQNAPHCDKKHNKNGLDCNFDCSWGYTMREDLQVKNQEQQMFALSNYKDSIMDLVSTWKALKAPVKHDTDIIDVVAERVSGKKRGRPTKRK